jgi:pyrroloquinoline quinone (PQQ) biosynthesis protein C
MRQAQPDDDALMEMGTTAGRIRLAYDEALGPVLAAGDAFPCRSRVAYGDWLAQTYHYVFHTSRLIALAASRCDVCHDTFHRRLVEYLGEEKDHDLLLLDDLAALGYSLDDFPEDPLTAAFWQVDYYRVEHQTPLALFGRSLLLEGAAAERGSLMAEVVADAHGEKAASFLRVHGQEDPGHVERAFATLEGVEEAEATVIAAALTQSGVLYRGMLDNIRRRAGH